MNLDQYENQLMDFKALQYSFLTQMSKLLMGPVLLIFLPRYINQVEQGYWFTMVSLAAITAFAEMGLSNIVLQFAAHAKSKATSDYTLDELLIFVIKRILLVALLVFPLTVLVGSLVLSGDSESQINWLFCWFIFCAMSCLNLILIVILSYFEGSVGVHEIQKIRFVLAIVNLVSLVVSLYCSLGLWALPVSIALTVLTGFLILCSKFSLHNYLKNPFDNLKVTNTYLGSHINPLLLRYSVSWIGGYFMFQLFVPIGFLTLGPIEAGKIGISISLFSSIFAISNIASIFQLPEFTSAIALSDKRKLMVCFWSALFGSLAIFSCGFLVIFLMDQSDFLNDMFLDRFLDFDVLKILALAWLLQLIVHNMAIYIRAFRIEPFSLPSLVAGLYIPSMTYICSLLWGVEFFFMGFLTMFIWFIPVAMFLFMRQYQVTEAWGKI